MGEFIITAPDGKRYKVTGDSAEGALGAVKKMLGQADSGQAMRDRIAAAKAGTLQLSPERAAAQKEIDQPVEDRMIVDAMGGATTRGLVAARGLPFVGEYVDEAIGAGLGGNATNQIRAAQDAFARLNPKEATALQIGGGVLGSIPLAGAAIASKAGQALSTGQKIIAGAGLGFLGGGVEGAIAGYGAGNDGNRGRSALERGVVGAGIGGVVGAAAPAVAAGVSNLFQRLKGTDIKAISRSLRISPDAAKVVKNAIENDDFDAARIAIERAGGKAMLADAGPAAQNLLDTAVQTSGKSARIVRDAVDERAALSAREMQGALDSTLGNPEGQGGLTRAIREGTADARQEAYSKAYAAPIDYAEGRGRLLEGFLKRVPGKAVARAKELMRLEGVESAQIMAEIADDGSVTFSRLPDVRQIDYITRALNDVADAADGQGKLGGTTALGRAYGDLSKNIRKTLKEVVPEYGQALDVASDAIGQRKAVDLGYDLLKAGTRRETVADAMNGASKAEIEATKQGARSYIDDTLANVRAAVTNPNLEISEFRKLSGDLRTRAAKDKLAAVLGPKEADALYSTLDENLTALELRAAIAQNSKTAARQSTQGMVKDVTAPGVVGTIAQGSPFDATRRAVQIFTGQTPEMVALRQQGIYDEIAQALTSIRGADAKLALAIVQRAIDGQPVTEAQARVIGRALGTATAIGGYQAGNQSLSIR